MKKEILCPLSVVSCLLFTLPAFGQDKGSGKVVLDVQGCVKKAIEVSPEIGEARYDEDVYRAKKMQADGAAYPQIEFLALTGPSPEAEEKDLFATNVKSTTINGIFGSATVTLIQPIYTFGKIGSYKEAAYRGTKAAEAGTQKKISEIVLRTKELYYSLLMARDMRNLVLEVRDELVKAINTAEKQIKAGSPGADEVNLFKLRAYLGESDKYLNETDKGIALSRDALVTSMGLPGDTLFEPADSGLSPEGSRPGDKAEYMRLSETMRPEFVQLREGLAARDALINAEKGGYYPDIFIGLMGSLSGATNRDTIDNPYIYDYFSHSTAAGFLGLKWSLDFGITRGKVMEAEAEYNKLAEKKRFAEKAIPLQVRKAFQEFEEADRNIEKLEGSYRNARKWLVAAMANFDLGVGEAQDVADSALAYSQMKSDYIRSIYNQRMAYANLLYASGTDLNGVR
jgi:outer membrane protein TolC